MRDEERVVSASSVEEPTGGQREGSVVITAVWPGRTRGDEEAGRFAEVGSLSTDRRS
jgi:hypothetical protein